MFKIESWEEGVKKLNKKTSRQTKLLDVNVNILHYPLGLTGDNVNHVQL